MGVKVIAQLDSRAYVAAAKTAGADYVEIPVAETTEIAGLVVTARTVEDINLAQHVEIIKVDINDKLLIAKAYETGKTLIVTTPKPPLLQDFPLLYTPNVYTMFTLPKGSPEPEDFNLDRACACKGLDSHFPHTIFDLAFAINRIYDDVFIEKQMSLISFDELASFVKQLQMIERMQRTRL